MIDWLSPSTWFSSSTSPSERRSSFFSEPSASRFSVRELERLHDLLLSEDELLSRTSSRSLSSLSPSARRHQKYIEALRAISEIVVWADQRTEGNSDASTLEEGSAIVELFLSRSMVKYFGDVLEASADDEQVVMQVLQTMNILIQNLRNEQTVYCVFSNNRVSEILSMESVFLVGRAGAAEDNDDVIGLYVNLLKTVVMRLDEHSVEFFLKEGRACVPYSRALRVSELDVARSDGMVRAAVQAVVLKLYSIVPSSVCLGGVKTEAFLARLCDEMIGTTMDLELLLRAYRWRMEEADNGAEPMTGGTNASNVANAENAAKEADDAFRIDLLLGRLEDDMAFFNDVLSTKRTEVGQLAMKEVWTRVVLGSIRAFQAARTSSKGGVNARARTLTALLVLEAACKAIESSSLMGLLVSLLLAGDAVKAAGKVVEDLGFEHLTVDALIGGPEPGNVVVDRTSLRENLLSCLTDASIDLSSRIVVLRILAVMLDSCTPDAVLREVGLRATDPADIAGAVASKDLNEANGAGCVALSSFPVGSGQLFESQHSVFVPERCAEIQRCIFTAALAAKQHTPTLMYETQALTYVAWILSGMLGRGAVAIEAPIEPLQEFLALAHDGLLLCLPTCAFRYAAPMILNHCWSVQQRYLTTLNPRRAPSKLIIAPQRGRDDDESLRRVLASATHFIAVYQLYQIVAKGVPEMDPVSPFPTDLAVSVQTVGDGHVGIDPLKFRTSLGTVELGASLVVRSDAGDVLFDAPTACVTIAPGAEGSSTEVTLASRTAEPVRGSLRSRSSVLRGVEFKSRLDRRYVERSVLTTRKDAEEQCRVYLEHCIQHCVL